MNEASPIAEAAATARAAEPVPAEAGKIGVLLVNLGTPDAADAPAVRRYLKEFLSDPRVIENQGRLWKLVLNGIILPVRPRRKARDYRKIWNQEKNESPLKTITRAQAEKLATRLEPLGRRLTVDWAMRYGNPAIASRLEAMVAQGCERILVLPLYPQYCAATTATVGDEVFRALTRMRKQPALRIAPPYYNDPVYIEALASSTTAELARLDFKPDVIVASFHGVPQDYVDKGDPYYAHCVETTRLLREQLKLDEIHVDDDVPVALRPRQMGWAGDRSHDETSRQARREKCRGDHARLLGRLPRNPGGDRGRERAYLQAARRREFRRHPVPQRQRARHAGDRADGAARAQRLGVALRRRAAASRHRAPPHSGRPAR